MTGVKRAQIKVIGRVQAVGYRFFAQQMAVAQHLNGSVCNQDDGSVEIKVQGTERAIKTYIEHLQQGPRFAVVDAVEVTWVPVVNELEGFQILY